MTECEGVLVAIGIGSNLNDPVRQVRLALKALGLLPKSRLIASSNLYRNPPMGPQDQPNYVNAAAVMRTHMQASELLLELQRIEQAQGRARREHWGPRSIDLDLLLYGETVIDEPHLSVPHPGLHERVFVLHPLAEIAPDLRVPGRGKVADLAAMYPADKLSRVAESSFNELHEP